MPKSVDYDLSQINAHIIAYSDRIQRGTKEDRATPACVGALTTAGLDQVTMAAIPESADVLDTEIREALAAGARFILILGGSGFGVGNYAPEVVRSIIEVEIGPRGGAPHTLEVVTPLLPAIFHQLDEQR